MCALHRYSTRFQMAKAQPTKALPTKAQPVKVQPVKAQSVQAVQAPAAKEPVVEVLDKPKDEAQNKPKTHGYETRLQSRLKKERADCKRISDLIQAATIAPDITISSERLYAIATLFEELYQTNLWKTHMKFNAIIRMKIGEIRNTIHMIRTCYDETVGIVVSGRTILMGYDYIIASYRALYAIDVLEKRMNA